MKSRASPSGRRSKRNVRRRARARSVLVLRVKRGERRFFHPAARVPRAREFRLTVRRTSLSLSRTIRSVLFGVALRVGRVLSRLMYVCMHVARGSPRRLERVLRCNRVKIARNSEKAKTIAIADSDRPKIYGSGCRVSREIRRFIRDVSSLLRDWKRIRIVCSSPVSTGRAFDKRSPKNTIGNPRADISASRSRRRASTRFLRNELSPLGRTRGKGHIARRATSSAPTLVSGISRRRALDTGARATA